MHRNNVLIVGGASIWAIETYYCKYLNELGLSTTIFNCSQFYDSNSIFFKIRIRAGDKGIYSKVNQELIKYCTREKPTIVWVFKGVEIYPETLCKLKKLGIVLVSYNPDHPFIRTSISHGGKNIPESVPYFDLHFSYSRDLAAKISAEYKIPSVLLPFGFELSQQDFDTLNHTAETNKVCFIGNPDTERVHLIKNIASTGLEIDIYGPGFLKESQITGLKNVNVFREVYALEYWKKIRQYRVQLNFFRPHNIGSHNQRTFEVPGVGGILLSPVSEEQKSYFAENREMFFYKDINDLAKVANEICSMSDEEIESIRSAARQRSILSGYSYKERAKIAFDSFKNLG